MSPDTPFPVIMGPTASGKSALALALARKVGGEIISVDSMQVYRGLDIGTAKPSQKEREEIRRHAIKYQRRRRNTTSPDRYSGNR